MAQKEYPVYGEGIRGVLIAPARFLDDRRDRLVRLEDGTELHVPPDALEPQPDGSFYLRQSARAAPAPPPERAPRERPAPGPAIREPEPEPASNGRQSTSSAAAAAEQFFRHGYDVQRVPIDKIIDQPVSPRQEGDTMIFPVVEEVLVVQKKLVLKEEIHVRPERAAIEPRRIES